MKNLFTILLLITLTFSAKAQSVNNAVKFESLLNKSGLRFTKPKGFTETSVIKNSAMAYDYAIINPASKIEIRFALHPLTNKLNNYKKISHTKKGSVHNPNEIVASRAAYRAMDISRKEDKFNFDFYSQEEANKRFNADAGYVYFINLQKNIVKNYNYCILNTIHKTNMAYAHVYILAPNEEIMRNFLSTNDAGNLIKFK